MTRYISSSAITRMVALSWFSVFLFLNVQSQFPEAISILPDSAAGFGEITLIFDPGKACVPDGWEGMAGLDSIFVESSAVLVYEEEGSWYHRIPAMEGIGMDGSFPILYPYDDSLFSITYTPSSFYGTGSELIKGITARFKHWNFMGLDFSDDGCQDFYIPFKLDTVELSFNVDLSYQIFLGYFDPFFDHIDVVGNFNNWGDPAGTDLEDPDGDSIYSVTLPDAVVDQTLRYRFRRNRSDETSESLDLPGYRTYLIREGENELLDWYNDLEPAFASLSVNVNMNYAEELEYFHPETDTVEIEMFFEHPQSSEPVQYMLSDPDSNGIYNAVIDDLWAGSEFNYIVNINGNQPGGIGYPWYTVLPGMNSLYFWWHWMDPETEEDLFFSGYLDGEGNNNAIEITNPSGSPVNLSEYGIMYTLDGSGWLDSLKMAGTLESHETWLIVHPGFDFSAIDSANVVDSVWSEPCSFDGNDALALVKFYDGYKKCRILDQVGLPGDDPGTGWDVAGIPDATSLHRLDRKQAIGHGNADWISSSGSSLYDSEWLVSGPEIPSGLGKEVGMLNYDHLWTTDVTGVTNNLHSVASTDNGWVFAVGDARTAIYKEAGSTQWKSLSLYIPENYSLNSVFFTDSLNGWIAGDNGTILYTANGIDWTSQQSNAGGTLNDVFFTDPENGWAVGGYTIRHTRDGGRTWEQQYGNPDAGFNRIHFTDANHGWIVCDNDHVRYTDDGGETWNQLTAIPGGSYRNLHFCDPLHGWIVGEGIYHTRDGGNTWTKLPMPDIYYYGVYFTSPLKGWVVGDNGVFSTNDGGVTWNQQSAENGDKPLMEIYFSSPNNGWIVGNDGLLLHTADGWTTLTSPNSSNLNAVTFTDDSTGWIVGDDYTVLKTVDAGHTWDTVNLTLDANENDSYADVFFIDPMTGWLGGAFGTLFHTKDGGKTWEQQAATNGWLYSVYFIDQNRGWAVGNGGAVSRTTDGGTNWIKSNIGSENFYDVYFPDPLHGWVVGELGRILYSDDGGISWVSQSDYTNTRLTTVYFSDSLHGITFSDHEVLRTENGGVSWEVSQGVGYKLCFIDSLHGWVTGDQNNIWHTRDGGATWLPLSTGVIPEIENLFFLNEDIGWAVGENGTILRTSSGGCKDPFVNLPGIARICEGEQITLGGGSNYSYSWSTGSVDSSITVSSAGWYRVEVENRCGKSAADSVYLEVIAPPEFRIFADGETAFCQGGQVNLICIPDNYSEGTEYYYKWEYNSEYTDNSYLADTSGYFSIEVRDRYGCSNSDSILVFEQNPYNEEEICLVTIDMATGKNMIIWNKTPDVGTREYNIYRESETIGQYNLIETVPYDQLSIFKDTTSFPEARQYLYKIASVDSCGNESEYSRYHKPLFLQYVSSIGGVNLQWSDYIVEGSPFDFVTYEIYRGSDSIALEKIGEVSASNDRYTDTEGDALTNRYYYRVAGVKDIPCYPGGTKKADGDYSRSISNMEDNGIASGLNDRVDHNDNALKIYPNPFSDRTLIQFPNSGNALYRLFITDLNGKIVKTADNISGDSYELNSGGLSKGVYFIELRGRETYRAKILVH